MGPVCEKCALNCPKNISAERRTQLFNEFYNLANTGKQLEYIVGCTGLLQRKHPIKQRRNVAFYFQTDSGRVRVCKTFLMNTLGICESKYRSAMRKCDENGELIVGDRKDKRQKIELACLWKKSDLLLLSVIKWRRKMVFIAFYSHGWHTLHEILHKISIVVFLSCSSQILARNDFTISTEVNTPLTSAWIRERNRNVWETTEIALNQHLLYEMYRDN